MRLPCGLSVLLLLVGCDRVEPLFDPTQVSLTGSWVSAEIQLTTADTTAADTVTRALLSLVELENDSVRGFGTYEGGWPFEVWGRQEGDSLSLLFVAGPCPHSGYSLPTPLELAGRLRSERRFATRAGASDCVDPEPTIPFDQISEADPREIVLPRFSGSFTYTGEVVDAPEERVEGGFAIGSPIGPFARTMGDWQTVRNDSTLTTMTAQSVAELDPEGAIRFRWVGVSYSYHDGQPPQPYSVSFHGQLQGDTIRGTWVGFASDVLDGYGPFVAVRATP